MVIIFYFNIFLLSIINAQDNSPSKFWLNYNKDQKIAFINGAYGAIAF